MGAAGRVHGARGRAEADRTRAVQLLRSALSHDPDLVSAHDRLADHFRREHGILEADRETTRARTALADLAEHDRSGRYASYVRGLGAISLATDPPGAEVRLHRYVEQSRRLVPRFERILGTTPLEAAPVEMGSYLLTLHRSGYDEVRYPVLIGREEAWDGVPPGARAPFPVALIPRRTLGPEDHYVPAGWAWVGDDTPGTTRPLERVWVGSLVMRRFVVTLEAYVAFLNALVDGGAPDRAVAMSPKLEGGNPFFGQDARGRFTGIRGDEEGPLWRLLRSTPRLPMVYVDLHQARAYAAWEAERTGLPWRVPAEGEWYHAGRGADARRFPWGDHFEASWTRCRSTAPDVHIVSVDDHPIDCSVYGIRGQAGNVAEWVENRDGSIFNVGGSCASSTASTTGLAFRVAHEPTFCHGRTGFRLVRPLR